MVAYTGVIEATDWLRRSELNIPPGSRCRVEPPNVARGIPSIESGNRALKRKARGFGQIRPASPSAPATWSHTI